LPFREVDQALGEVHEMVAAADVREIVNEEGLRLISAGKPVRSPSGIRIAGRRKSTTRGSGSNRTREAARAGTNAAAIESGGVALANRPAER
jgi:hypothetical protein